MYVAVGDVTEFQEVHSALIIASGTYPSIADR